MRTVFFGTPALAIPALRALTEVSTVLGVVSQPDRPAGRGLRLHEPEVKTAARALGLKVYQPQKVRTGELGAWLTEQAPDVAVVMAYGRILPPEVLRAPSNGCINLHASLLPQYRGAAPIQWAVIRGETTTGISIMQMDEGMDTGPVYIRRALPISPNETAGELADRLGELAAELVRTELAHVVGGELGAQSQAETGATYAPPLTRADTHIQWTRSASEIHNLVRGLSPRPGAFTSLNGKTLKILGSRVLGGQGTREPGRVELIPGHRIAVQTGKGVLEIVNAQLEGRKALDAASLIHGRAFSDGDVLNQ